MKHIYFRYDKELIYFCEIFFRMYHEIHVTWRRNTYWGNELQFTEQSLSIKQLLPIFVKVFTYHRFDSMLRDIVMNDYFYTDDAEIDHICELTKWLMADNETGASLFNPQPSLEDFMYENFMQHVGENNPIHFDALVKFCMKPLTMRLVNAVGVGIDEMKREEEHQKFIHDAREYVEKRTSKQSVLYIIQGEEFHFLKPTGEAYSIWELKEIMQKEPLYVLGLDEDEKNIAPVLALLPKQIYLYGNDLEEPKTIALLSIFQERVQLFPTSVFPFPLQIK